MSEANLPVFTDNSVFTDPAAAAELVFTTDRADPIVIAPNTPVQLTGTDVTITTAANTSPTDPVELVVNGLNNVVNLGTGSALVNVVGGGAIVEAVQLVNSDGQPIADIGKAVNLGGGDPTAGGIAYNGGLVDTTALVGGNSVDAPKETVSQAAGSLAPVGTGFAYYTHGGTGNDSIVGSNLADFIRGGAGNDLIDASNGDDLVRGGTGNDTITLGGGIDTLYYTLDQVGGNNVDILTDFLTNIDKIAIQGGIGVFDVDGNAFNASSTATQTIVFKSGASQTTLTNSGANTFNFSDIVFLA
jgi:Ca2+-binding RTX toxin-like protein